MQIAGEWMVGSSAFYTVARATERCKACTIVKSPGLASETYQVHTLMPLLAKTVKGEQKRVFVLNGNFFATETYQGSVSGWNFTGTNARCQDDSGATARRSSEFCKAT